MYCEWSSSKVNSIRDSADAGKRAGEEALREVRALKKQFDAIQRDQAKIIENQDKIARALSQLAETVQKMHDELYPKPENTKPALKAPAPGT